MAKHKPMSKDVERATKEMIKDPLRFFVILCRLAGHKQVVITDENKALGQIDKAAVRLTPTDRAVAAGSVEKTWSGEAIIVNAKPVHSYNEKLQYYPRQIQGPKGVIIVSLRDPQELAVYVKRSGILNLGAPAYVTSFDPLDIASCCSALVNIGLADLPEPVAKEMLNSLAKVKP